MIKSPVFLPLSQVFSEKTLEYSHLMAEIFEKVAKIGVGVHIWLLQVSKLTHH